MDISRLASGCVHEVFTVYKTLCSHAHTVVNKPRISWQLKHNFRIASPSNPIFIGEGVAKLLRWHVSELWMHFSMHLFPALKRSSLAQNVFVPGTKSVHLQHNKSIHFFGRWFRKPRKQHKCRDERTQEDYHTSAVYFCKCRVVLLRSLISVLFLPSTWDQTTFFAPVWCWPVL